MAEPAGTIRTPWAASWDGGYTLYAADTREQAVGTALEEAQAEHDAGDMDATEVEILVARDCLWCTGEEVTPGNCHCEGEHEWTPFRDGGWLLIEWTEAGSETRALEVSDG